MKRGVISWLTAIVSRVAGPLAFIAIAWTSYAQERFDLLHVGRAWYTNAVVTGKTPTNINISHAHGTAVVKVVDLDAPTLARLRISPPQKANTLATAAPGTRPNLIIKKIPNTAADEWGMQLIAGVWFFVVGFFFICNIVRPILNGFIFHVGYLIYFGTGVMLMSVVDDLRKHGLTELKDFGVRDSAIAVLNLLAWVALFRIAARTFAARAAGVRQYASVRNIGVGWIISLTDFIQLGVYSGCYILGPIIGIALR